MSCCRCNRMGRCQSCCCVKRKRHCTNCLPVRLGNCANLTTASAPSVQDSSTAPPARAATVRPVATTPPTSAQIDIVVTTPTQTAATPPHAVATNLALRVALRKSHPVSAGLTLKPRQTAVVFLIYQSSLHRLPQSLHGEISMLRCSSKGWTMLIPW